MTDRAPACPILPALVIAALAVLAFLPALASPRACVDPDGALRVSMIATPRHIPAIFGADMLFYTEGQYRPLGYAALSLGRALARPENAPFWGAWLLAFHLLNSMLVFAVARRLAKNPAAAVFAAALFALHPLASLFAGDAARFPFLFGGTLCLASLLAYLSFARSGRPSALVASVALFAGAMLTSKAAWALPPVVLVLELAWERRRVLPALARVAPFVVAAAAALALAFSVRPHPVRFEYPPFPVEGGPLSLYTFTAAAPRAAQGVVLGTGFQSPPSELVDRVYTAFDLRFYPVALIALVLAAFAVYELARRRWIGLGILVAILGMLPFASLAWHRVAVPLTWDAWYAGVIGFALAAGALADTLLSSPSANVRTAARIAAAVWVAAFAVMLVRENVARRDPVSYWTHALDANPRSEIVSRRLGAALMDAGDRSGAMHALFSPSVNSVPRSAFAAGLDYLRDNEPLAAIAHFHRAERFEDPDPLTRHRIVIFAARLTLAVNAIDYAEASAARARLTDPWDVDALNVLAEVFLRKGYFHAARRHVEEALAIIPDDPEAASILARIDAEQSTAPVDAPRVIKPASPSVLGFLIGEHRDRALCESMIPLAERLADDPILQLESGMCYLSLGLTEPARERLKSVAARLPHSPYLWASERASRDVPGVVGLAVSPDTPERSASMWNDMGYLLYQRGELTEAVACFRAAVAADPKLASAHTNLGLVLTVQNKRDEAIACYRTAIALAPGEPDAYRNLASVLLAARDWAEARRVLESAIEAVPGDRDVKVRLAWVLATAPADDLRDGRRAVTLVEGAIASGEPRRANDLNVLAAALAECGDYDRAVSVAREAISLGMAEPNAQLVKAVVERLGCYERRTPWRMR